MKNKEYMKCKIHGLTIFEITKRKDRKNTYLKKCRKCQNQKRKDRYNNKKKQCIDYKGNVCNICNKKYLSFQYDFHHINPKSKKFNIKDKMNLKFEELTEELDKCILICSSCHLKIHGKERRESKEKRTIESLSLKSKLIEYAGNKCQLCEESNRFCLSFHHLDENNKSFTISQGIAKRLPTYLIMTEVEKCSLLCENCHRKVHYDSFNYDLFRIKLSNDQKEFIHDNFFRRVKLNKEKNKVINKKCEICLVGSCKTNRRKYCSDRCLYIAGHKNIKLNNKGDLIIFKIIKSMIEKAYNYSEVARIYNVSDVSIYNRIKVFSGLERTKIDEDCLLNEYVLNNFNEEYLVNKYNLKDSFDLYVNLAKSIRNLKKSK